MPDSLIPLFRPRSVAVIGASRRRSSIGGAILHNLIAEPFEGPVYPVNPGATHVQSVPAFPDVESIPGTVDLAIVVVPAARVLDVVEACGRKGVRALVVISAGFREVGEEGAAREAALRELICHYGMRLVGPNCLGVVNTDPDVRLNATFVPVRPTAGRVSFSSQSGALGFTILDYARALNLGVAQFVSVGNKADVSGNDLIEFWERDPNTDVILLYLESFGNSTKFTQIARRVARTKPIIAVKSGRTPSGSRAASSHTGALAGSEEAVEALFRQSGVIRTDTIEELFDTALLLAFQPVPAGPRVGIVTNAGGPGIMAADACESAGLLLPSLEAKTVKELRSFLPPEASTRNPVDMIASADAPSFERAVRLILADKNIDSVLAIFVPPLTTGAEEVARAILSGATGTNKPVLSCFMGSHGLPEALSSLNEGRIPSYSFPEAAALTIARAVAYGAWRSAPPGKIPTLRDIDVDRARKALGLARERAPAPSPRAQPASRREGAAEAARAGSWMPQGSLAELLDAYGIGLHSSRIASNRGEAAAAAKAAGFPVALKVRSPDVVHKSDVGGVRLGLRSEEEVARAFDDVAAALRSARPDARFEGVSVESMVVAGVEMIVGMTRDPTFGPLVLFGLGGVTVELLRDVSLRIAPLTDRDTREMIEGIRGYPLLTGYRGAPPVHVEAIEELLHRVSRLAVDHPEVVELDLNPVLAFPGERPCLTLDARVRIVSSVSSEPPAPVPA